MQTSPWRKYFKWMLIYVCNRILLSCLRTPVEGTRHATTTRFVNRDFQTRDIDVCATLDLLANTATKVHVIWPFLEKAEQVHLALPDFSITCKQLNYELVISIAQRNRERIRLERFFKKILSYFFLEFLTAHIISLIFKVSVHIIFEFVCKKKSNFLFGTPRHLPKNLYMENTVSRFELGFPWKIWVDFPNRRLNAFHVFDDFLMTRYRTVLQLNILSHFRVMTHSCKTWLVLWNTNDHCPRYDYTKILQFTRYFVEM